MQHPAAYFCRFFTHGHQKAFCRKDRDIPFRDAARKHHQHQIKHHSDQAGQDHGNGIADDRAAQRIDAQAASPMIPEEMAGLMTVCIQWMRDPVSFFTKT